jgi:glycosyltransferase involved in cell wall biosynthesis
MACGSSVVSSRLGGIVDMIDEGETGFLVAPGDERALANALRPLLEDRALRTRMGAKARRSYHTQFSYRVYQQNLAQILSATSFSERSSAAIADWLMPTAHRLRAVRPCGTGWT